MLLLICTVLNLLFLLSVWFLQETRAESHWIFTYLAYMPQHPFVVPTLLLLLWCGLSRKWKTIKFQLPALLVWLFPLMGLQLHQPAPAENSMRIMTWNVYGGAKGMDGIVQEIQNMQPQILCLQEARAFGPQVFARLQGQDASWQMAQADELVVLTHFPVLSKKRLVFEGFSNIELQTVLQTPQGPLTVVTVHFERHRLFGTRWDRQQGRDREERNDHWSQVRQEAVRVLLKAQQEAQQQGQAFVACGDFNTPPHGPIYGQINHVLNNAFATSGRGFDYTWNSDLPVLRIDHIWGAPGVRFLNSWVPPTTASDHLPVLADMQLAP